MLELQAPHNDGAGCVFSRPYLGQGVCAAKKKRIEKWGGLTILGRRMPVILETKNTQIWDSLTPS